MGIGLGLGGVCHRAELGKDRPAGVEAAHEGLERLVRVEGEGEGGG